MKILRILLLLCLGSFSLSAQYNPNHPNWYVPDYFNDIGRRVQNHFGYQPFYNISYQQAYAGQIMHAAQFIWVNDISQASRSAFGPVVSQPIAISKIYIRAGDSIKATDYYNFTVKMGHVDSTELSWGGVGHFRDSHVGIPINPPPSFFTGLSTVFISDTFSVPEGKATTHFNYINYKQPPWVVIELDTPFIYQGPGYAIVIEMSHEGFKGGGFPIGKQAWVPNVYDRVPIIYGNPPFGSADVAHLARYEHFSYGFDTIPTLDAQVYRIPDIGNSSCSGLNPVRLVIRNAGSHTINTLRLDWELDGIAQAPYFYTGNLASFQRDTVVLGFSNFPPLVNTEIKAWSSLPNNRTDDYVLNDTLSRTVSLSPSSAILPGVDLGANASFCIGDSVALNNSTPGLSNFLWDDQSTNPGRVVQSGGTYYLIAQDANGCFSSDTIIITQNPLPIVDLGNDRDICPRDNVVLTGGNSQMNAYLWDDRSTAMSRTVSYAGTYWVQVTDPNGCQNSDTVRITSPGQPSGSMSVYDRSGGRYDFSIMNAYNVQSYIWDFGDGSPQATGSNVSHAYSSNGNYVVRVTLQGVCPNQVVQLQHQLRVRTVGMEDIQNTLGVKLE